MSRVRRRKSFELALRFFSPRMAGEKLYIAFLLPPLQMLFQEAFWSRLKQVPAALLSIAEKQFSVPFAPFVLVRFHSAA